MNDAGEKFIQRYQDSAYRRVEIEPPKPLSEETIRSRMRKVVRATDPSAGRRAKNGAESRYSEALLDTQRNMSHYEVANWYFVIMELAREIELAAASSSFDLPQRPTIGTVPLGSINAEALQDPFTGEYAVIFDWELYRFALYLSRAVVDALPVYRISRREFDFHMDPQAIRRNILSKPGVLDRFVGIVMGYAETGKLPNVGQGRRGIRQTWLAANLCISLELFALGHEYAHIICRHLDRASRRPVRHMKNAVAIGYSWQQEYEADLIGAELMMSALLAKDPSCPEIYFWGADFYFSAMDVMDSAIEALGGKSGSSGEGTSHPPREKRRELLRGNIHKIIPGEISGEHVQDCMARGICLQQTMAILWELALPRIEQARARGASPAGKWRVPGP